MKRKILTLLAMIAGSIAVACTVVAADSYKLITLDEFTKSMAAPDDEDEFERAFQDPLAPLINVMRPGEGSEYQAPIDIELSFEAQDGAEIDIESLKITYGALGIDVTDRVTEHATVTTDGILSEDAELPKGRHKLTVVIADTEGRVSKKRFKFKIVD